MTWSMFAINWLELGDFKKAAYNFNKSYALYRRLPFNVSLAAANDHKYFFNFSLWLMMHT